MSNGAHKKVVVIVPSLKNININLERFQSEALENPLFSIVTWTHKSTAQSLRSRQLAIERTTKTLYDIKRIANSTITNPKTGCKQDGSSWFIGNNVVSDGSLVSYTKMDPLFILVMCLWQSNDDYISLYDALASHQNTWWLRLLAVNDVEDETDNKQSIALLNKVGMIINFLSKPEEMDVESLGNMQVKLNIPNVLNWLIAKINKVAVVLNKRSKEISGVDSNSVTEAVDDRFRHIIKEHKNTQDTTLQKDGELNSQDEISLVHKREALSIVEDYIPQELLEMVQTKLQIPIVENVNAIEQDIVVQNMEKNTTNTVLKTKRTAITSSKQKSQPKKKKSKLDHVDRSGMKAMTSFFKKS